jgi:hypothetical protein
VEGRILMNKTLMNTAKILPVILLMVLLASCGKGDEHKSYETVKLLQGDTYYYEGKFYDGSDLDGYTIKMAVKGSEFVIVFSDEKGAELGRSLKIDGKGYYVDTASKEYSRDAYYDAVSFAYSEMTFLESGSAKITAMKGIDDQEYTFEKYETTYGAEKGVMYFYYKGDDLYAIQENFVDAAGTDISEVVVINKISSEISKEWFDIPEDYKETK